MAMPGAEESTTFVLGDRRVRRLGFGAMQLAGPIAFGPPKDRAAALAVLREAIASGVNHIDTSDYYGPHVTNRLIHEALHPYPDDLVIVTKVGARRGRDGSVLAASTPGELRAAVHDNLRNLGVAVLDVVNLRNMFGVDESAADALEVGLGTLADLQRQGLDVLARDGIAYVPFAPLGGGLTPVRSSTLSGLALALGATPAQIGIAWLLHRAPNLLLIPGTSSLTHLRENLLATTVRIPDEALAVLDEGITPSPERRP